MTRLSDLMSFLEKLIPLDLQDSWDNCGLQVGDQNKEIKKVGFSLSVSKSVIEEARKKEIDLIITHHPLTVSGLKSINNFSYPAFLLLELIKHDIAVYSLHTNLDVSELGPTKIIAEYLDIKVEGAILDKPPYGITGSLKSPFSQKELFERLKSFLPLDVFRCINPKMNERVEKVAICSGSGASFIELVAGKVDVYITGDIKYHDALKAIDLGLTVFDMGHFGTERLFFKKLINVLKETFKEVEFIVLEEKSPYEVI
ncbi:MAG: Nif3-like dinuclear metal center hexameric protein [Desulfurobacteriaceae bacterium]